MRQEVRYDMCARYANNCVVGSRISKQRTVAGPFRPNGENGPDQPAQEQLFEDALDQKMLRYLLL
jgi:hypothetical protein